MFASHFIKAIRIVVAALVLTTSTLIYGQFQNQAITTDPYGQGETAIAVSPLNPNYLLGSWTDGTANLAYAKPGYGFSTNGGTTWYASVITLPPTVSSGYTTSVTFDRYGNAFYCYVGIDPFYNIYVARTTQFPPQSNDWTSIKISTGFENIRPRITVDNTGSINDGRIYVSWTDYTNGTAKFSYSSNHGATFSTPLTLSDQNLGYRGESSSEVILDLDVNTDDIQRAFVGHTQVSVGPSGEVYVVWSQNDSNYKIRKSTNGGVSFAPEVTVSNYLPKYYYLGTWFVIRSYNPTMAVSPTNGYIYVSYAEPPSLSSNDFRIKFIRSTNGGTTWSSPQVIADFNIGLQFFPWIAVDSNGKISVVVGHSSDFSSADAYLTESYDNGSTFTTPERVSSESSFPSYGYFAIHYQGVATIHDGTCYALWTDFRNGNADPFFAYGNLAAMNNKSFTPSATAHNNNHVIERGYYGKLHEVFTCGGEIYYRRSSNNGTSWEFTTRISNTNNFNNHPSDPTPI